MAMLAAWSSPAGRINDYLYDWMLTRQSPESWNPQSIVVGIDEQTLRAGLGMRNIRSIVAKTLDQINVAQPQAVALDVILADETDDYAGNAALESAMRATRNLVLPCQLVNAGTTRKWEYPLPRFRPLAAALGHVNLKPAERDGVTREIPLEEIAGREHQWALSLSAFGLAHGQAMPTESPDDVQIGEMVIPTRRSGGRPMLIRYLRGAIQTISAIDVGAHPEAIRQKIVFLGITASSAALDRRVSPYGDEITGVQVHAQAFETMARGRFLTYVRNDVELLLCAIFAVSAGLIFGLRSGWQAYALACVLLAVAGWMPLQFFRHDVVFPYFASVSVAWFSTVGAASYQYFFVQRALKRSESEKSRYQQAIHWAAHEMRTPLTTIQGSSEIMTRYALPDEKRQQLSEMINSESKRLARLIQTFLDVERLAEGQMELKREPFSAAAVVETCMKRVGPIAERKKIAIFLDTDVEGTLTGDRELMEYAFYNLLTNAVKYSPSDTQIHVFAEFRNGELHLSVKDQGIGMDQKELKSIFKKFYRTKRAEASGEAGTGIGLSIVEQIVSTHGGRMEVSSEPGKGSCFTMIVAAHAEIADRRG
jgi:signal transduction histidine kinase